MQGSRLGSHSFRVRAIDAAGNVDSTPASHGWTVDTTAPDTSVDSGPSATHHEHERDVHLRRRVGSSFECSLDEAAFAACTSPREYTALAAGAHTLRVRAKDAAENVDASPASHNWTIQATGGCAGSTVTAGAIADTWVLQSSSSSNYGNDSVVRSAAKPAPMRVLCSASRCRRSPPGAR
jgi:hypothetical protein